MRRNRPRTVSGHVATSGSRELVKLQSPRLGAMPSNGPIPPHAYQGKPGPSLVATGPGMRHGTGETPPNAYGPRRSRAGRYKEYATP